MEENPHPVSTPASPAPGVGENLTPLAQPPTIPKSLDSPTTAAESVTPGTDIPTLQDIVFNGDKATAFQPNPPPWAPPVAEAPRPPAQIELDEALHQAFSQAIDQHIEQAVRQEVGAVMESQPEQARSQARAQVKTDLLAALTDIIRRQQQDQHPDMEHDI